MAVLLRIKDWPVLFENNRTRELKHMEWVPIPNRMDGDGYTELMDHPNAAAHFGAWISMVEVASRCDPRGTLLRDGAKPHDSRSLERMTRISAAVYDEAIPRLLSIGWIESEIVASNGDTKIPHEGAVIPQEGASSRARAEWNGRERKGTEHTVPPAGGGVVAVKHPAPQSSRDEPLQSGEPAPDGVGADSTPSLQSGDEPPKRGAVSPDGESFPPGFLAFWAEWPKHERKKAKSKCARFWKRRGLERIADQVVAAVKRFKTSPGWRRQCGQYIPGPEPWLNVESWEVPSDALVPRDEESPDGDRDSPGFDRRSPNEDDLRRALGLGPDDPLPADVTEHAI